MIVPSPPIVTTASHFCIRTSCDSKKAISLSEYFSDKSAVIKILPPNDFRSLIAFRDSSYAPFFVRFGIKAILFNALILTSQLLN